MIQVIARSNGSFCWFEVVARRADPEISEVMQLALQQVTPIGDLRFKNMTPEMRSVYQLAAQQIRSFAQPQQDEKRLRKALQIGGELHSFQDREDYWTIDWTTTDGVRHTSAIAKTDLTVISSGICLSGRDFDLHSLVGVMEQQ